MYPCEADIEEMKAAAESGDSQAAFDLGWCYYIGNGMPQDKSKAWHWYSEAASRGVAAANDILQILEAEARRASELESQIRQERQAVLQGHRARWVVAVILLVACLGSVGSMLYVLDRDSSAGDAEAGIQGDKAMTPGSEPVHVTDNRRTVREEGPSVQLEGVAAIPEAGGLDNAADREKVVAIPEQEAEPEPKPRSPRPEGPSRERESSLANIARMAERWLEEPNDPDGSN